MTHKYLLINITTSTNNKVEQMIDSGMSTSGNAARGKRKDNDNKSAIVKHQNNRRFIEDLDNLMMAVFG